MSFKYPKGEVVWVSYFNNNHELMYIITSKQPVDYYYLYEVVDDSLKKLGKGKSPLMLEDKFKICVNLKK